VRESIIVSPRSNFCDSEWSFLLGKSFDRDENLLDILLATKAEWAGPSGTLFIAMRSASTNDVLYQPASLQLQLVQ
jgi:hypothetical protein